MGSSFTVWKVVIILICLAGLGLSLFGGRIWDAAAELVEQNVTWSFSYNEQEGSRFAALRAVQVNGKELKLETVQDREGIRQGLSDRRSMRDDEGMLFVMPNVDVHPFWMNRMHFALDIIWMREGTIVDIAPNMLPPTETGGVPMVYTPGVLADQVLEITAGGVDRYGLKVGDKVDF